MANPDLVAYCGLYCGQCRKHLKNNCSGCATNEKLTWCAIRTCCIGHGYKSCAECTIVPLAECKKFNNFIGKTIGLLFNSDRAACIARIKEAGYMQFAAEMEDLGRQSLPRKGKSPRKS